MPSLANRVFVRARLGGLSRDEAELACKKLTALNAACFPLRIN